MGSWIDQELAGCRFAGFRLANRFSVFIQQLSKGLGRTTPLACGDGAAPFSAEAVVPLPPAPPSGRGDTEPFPCPTPTGAGGLGPYRCGGWR